MMNTIFWYCVEILKWIAASLGVTYQEANVYIFVILWPVITLMMTGYIIHLRRELKNG